MKKEDVDWDRQAREFLEKHGWEIIDGMGYHELYPLAEDFSMGRFEKFCEEFYAKAWGTYKAVVNAILIDDEEGDEPDE